MKPPEEWTESERRQVHRLLAELDRLETAEQKGIEGFCEALCATVRECIDCGCLIAGGPTRCKRCAKEYRVQPGWYRRLRLHLPGPRWRLGAD
jgi:hypothetical protein